MEFTKENMRFYIFIRCKLGESAKLIHETLQTVCGDCACSYQTVCHWVKEFNEGKESISVCPRPGRPKSCLNEQTIDSIKKGIDEDSNISVRELSNTNGLSYGTVHTIITEHLRMKKVCIRWTPLLSTIDQNRERVHCATELLNMFEPQGPKRLSDIVTGDETWFPFFIIPPKRLNRTWVDGQGDRPVMLSPGFQNRKRMFTVFFNYSGPLEVDMLPQDTTMTATYYVQDVLSQVKSAINEQRQKVSTYRILLLHDNTGPHKARATTQSLRELGVQVFAYPPTVPTWHYMTSDF
ncbi:transposase [Elysia marginata]|uniref:Transposase n=1 Tax=Elysia marginata TaxID=1093978 RepID=A0AAV4JXX3_9GAST|nr:transposase [Elysia marginata]